MVTLILLNGGFGVRVGADVPKQLLRLKGIPIFIYALRVADEIDEIANIVLNYPKGWGDKVKILTSQYAIKTPIVYVEAGETRQSSVRLMLDIVETPSVLIHEAARPLVSKKDFIDLMDSAADNVTQILPIPFTVLQSLEGETKVGSILDRARLLNIQLPQKFKTETLKIAHAKAQKSGEVFTEDASAVFHYGNIVEYITGSDRNFKITTKLDVQMAEFLLIGDKTLYE